MVKKIAKIICIIAAVTSLGACSTKKSTSAGKVVDGKKVITMSVISEDQFLKNAIAKYEEAHKDVKIEVKEYSPLPEGAINSGGKVTRIEGSGAEVSRDTEKYISTVNTELMSGSATDIIALEELPFEKYAEKGLLADLKPLMDNDKSFIKEDYYYNVIDALNMNNKSYVLPVTFGIDMLSANKAVLDSKGISINSNWSWNDFAEIAKQVAGGTGADKKYALSNMNEGDLISSMVSTSYEKFVDENKKAAKFDSKEFIDLLNTGKKMVDEGLVNTAKSDKMVKDMGSRGGTIFNLQTVNMPVGLTIARTLFGDETQFYNMPGSGSEFSFSSALILGINNKSAYKNEAWDFLNYLISEEAQSGPGIIGLPINKKALDANMEKAMNPSGGMQVRIKTSNDNGQGKPITLTEADAKAVKEYASKIKKYGGTNQKILNIIKEEVPAFFSGQKSAEDVGKLVQNKVNTYLKE
jgi:multiple sugar transport system substrate-binding protein